MMPKEGRLSVGHELGGDEFVNWVSSRSPKVQVEVLENAPRSIQTYFYPHLSDFCVEELGIHPKPRLETRRKIRYIDNRSKK